MEFIIKNFLKDKLDSFSKIVKSLLFVNGIIYIMSIVNLLDTANAISLRNIASSIESKTSSYANSSDSVTILISNVMYEKEFQSISPIDKEKLEVLLNKITSKNPKTIVIDLDISPDYDFSQKTHNYMNKDLYKLLKNNSKDINIILPFAFFAQTEENKALKREWISSMCEGGVNFGLPSLNSEMGISLKYNDYKNSMPSIATIKDNQICKDIFNSDLDVYTLLKKYEKQYANSEQYPINFKYINSHTITIDTIDDLEQYDLKNKTVFLGGGYGYGDKYITPYGEKFGIQVHESIFYTISHKIDEANTALTLFADFLLAITFGLLMGCLLKYREVITSLNGLAINNILLFLLLLIFIAVSTALSSLMFHSLYIWLNPIPLIIGMFLDSIIGISEKSDINKSVYKMNNSIHYILVFMLRLVGVWSILETALNL